MAWSDLLEGLGAYSHERARELTLVFLRLEGRLAAQEMSDRLTHLIDVLATPCIEPSFDVSIGPLVMACVMTEVARNADDHALQMFVHRVNMEARDSAKYHFKKLGAGEDLGNQGASGIFNSWMSMTGRKLGGIW